MNSLDIRLPGITGQTETEQLGQIRSYLYQLAGQLQFALGSVSARQQSLAEQTALAVEQAAQNTHDTSFQQVKSLIIKSADIVDAYYQQIDRRLESKYLAQSAFGDYSRRTAQDITENADGIQRVFTDLQRIEGRVDSIRDQTLAVTAYVKTGLLEENDDGFPVYGLEIGQENARDGEVTFRKFARFTADKLSFYDNNDREVAYFSDYQMYITNVRITGQLNHGGYVIDPAEGLTWRWKGEDYEQG